LFGSAPLADTPSELARNLFDPATSGTPSSELGKDLFDAAKETGKVLRDQLDDQIKAREDLDLRKAAQDGIYKVLLDTGKESAVMIFDDGTRALIERLPDDQRFSMDVWYNTFVSPKTRGNDSLAGGQKPGCLLARNGRKKPERILRSQNK